MGTILSTSANRSIWMVLVPLAGAVSPVVIVASAPRHTDNTFQPAVYWVEGILPLLAGAIAIGYAIYTVRTVRLAVVLWLLPFMAAAGTYAWIVAASQRGGALADDDGFLSGGLTLLCLLLMLTFALAGGVLSVRAANRQPW